MSDIAFRDLVGKTIASVEAVGAEFGRTFNSYVLVTTTDGDRAMLNSASYPRDAGTSVYGKDTGWIAHRPPVEEMKKAPVFFTPEDIADRVLADERDERRRQERRREEKQRQLEQLQRELAS